MAPEVKDSWTEKLHSAVQLVELKIPHSFMNS